MNMKTLEPFDFKVPANTRPWDAAVMKLNVPTDVIIRNISLSVRRQLPQHSPFEESSQHIAIVGGGWSLKDPQVYEELRELYFSQQVKLVALNGAANWLMERNLRPSMHVVMDARTGNLPFLDINIPGCKYFLASQCDAALFDAVADREVTLFHVISSDAEEERMILDEFYAKRWVQVPGAGTIGIVGVLLCRMLGFKFQHLFGIDSCYAPDGSHHAYPQSLNDAEGSADFWVAARKFRCSAWQASQADNFIKVIQHHGNHLQLSIHGDGVLAHMLKTGASLEEAKEEGCWGVDGCKASDGIEGDSRLRREA